MADIFAVKNLPDQDLQPYFKAFQFGHERSVVIGSYSLESQRNAGDIDVDVYIQSRIEYDFVNREIKNIVKKIDDNDKMFFIELKVQYKDPNKKKKFFATQIDDVEIPKENFNQIEYIKIDMVIFLVDSFKEISVNYWLNPVKHDVEQSIIDDIADQIKEKNYYKAVKWTFSLAKFLDDKPKGLLISKFLNNYTGGEYKVLKNLKAIKLLLENYDDPQIRNMVRVNLKNYNITPKISVVNRLIPQLEKKVNKEAKKYLDDVILKKNL
jgi:hypothetical protein